MTKVPVVYVETSVFLAFFAGEAARGDLCKEILEEGRRQEKKIVTSAFTLVEVLRGKPGTPKLEDQIDNYFQHKWLSIRQLERVLAIKARKLARKFNLKAGDAVHLATAIDCGAGKLLTYDSDLLDLKDPGIEIGEPKGQMPLVATTKKPPTSAKPAKKK